MQKPSTPATQTDLNSLDDSIPSHISLRLQKSHFQPRKRPSSSQKSSKSLQQVSLDSLILDKDLNYAQKERIAEAILKEKTDELEPIKQSRRPEVHLRPHIDAHRQRFAYQPKLFGVVSHSAPLLPPYMKDRQVEIQRHKEVVGHGPTEYRWGPKAVPTVPAYVPSITSKDEYNSEYLTRAEIIAENKRVLVRRGVEQVRSLRNVIQEYNAEYTETRRREISYQRNIAAFRQRIFDYLKERNDPQTSAIMRSLQDHVIQSFIETYKGNVMSIDAVLERIGANVHLTYSDGDIHTDYQSHSTPPTDGMITPDVVEEGGPQPFQKTEPIKKLSKLNKSFSVESHLPSSKADPSIKLNHREYLSRGAGFRSPNQKSHHPLQISAYIQSPMIQNTNPSVEEGAIINQLQQGYSTPPAPQSYGMEDSLTLDSLSLPYSLPPQHPNPHNRSLKPKISSQKSSSNSSSKWVLNQDSEPAPVPRKDQQQEKKKRQGPSTPSSSTSAGMASRPISTTNYGGGLYAISSYKNVLDKDYLENL